MAIYQLFDEVYDPNPKKEPLQGTSKRVGLSGKIEAIYPSKEELPPSGAKWFSGAVSRCAFLFLLVLDIGWLIVSVIKGCILLCLHGLYKKQAKRLQQVIRDCRRALVCAAALFLGLFSPAFGILVAWTYFSSYDTPGLHEVLPRGIREQLESLSNNS